jgi:hypothetical protein
VAIAQVRTVRVTRYVAPLREGGSLPAIVEAEDDGLYVLKFRGAGQGPRALIAELVAGEVARALQLPVPEIVFAELDAELARTEPDPEIHALILDSAGLNLALDYLPGSVTYDPVAQRIDPDLASRIVWFDAFVSNVDRTVRNTNMLLWHRKIWLIDHGASLYFHHGPEWEHGVARPQDPFPMIKHHVLLPYAPHVSDVDAEMAERVTEALIDGILRIVPDAWLAARSAPRTPTQQRQDYARYFSERIAGRQAFVEEALRAR